MNPIIIDNFLSSRYFLRIKEVIDTLPWYFKKCITFPDDPSDCLYSYGFENQVIRDFNVSNDYLFNLLSGFYSQLLDATECSKISRSRIDMVTYSPTQHQHTIHVDEYFPHIASVFYLTDSDAETIIFDQKCFSHDQLQTIDLTSLKVIKTVQPKENRILIFNGQYLHTGCSPAKYKNRIIINSDTVK
jgi:hypothetical protein